MIKSIHEEAARFTAEQTLMDSNIEIRELKHLLLVAEDKIVKLEEQNAKLLKAVEFHKVDLELIESDIDNKGEFDERKWPPE
tara:strand:+ start:5121 stop:5366 length:246 start_codon:yes stop_codon:yes gene_type:complete